MRARRGSRPSSTIRAPSSSTRRKTGCTCKRPSWPPWPCRCGPEPNAFPPMKIVLAYSGGLDTSVIVKWLRETYDAEIVTFAADIGQEEELKGLAQKAKKTGASKHYTLDLVEEFARDFIYPMIRANAIYEGQYHLGTSPARSSPRRRSTSPGRKRRTRFRTAPPARATTSAALS